MKEQRQAKFEACDYNTLEFNKIKRAGENVALNEQERVYSNIWGSTTQNNQVPCLPLNTQAAHVASVTSVDTLQDMTNLFIQAPES